MSALGGGVTFARLANRELRLGSTPVEIRVGRLGRRVPMELRVSCWWPGRGGSLVELLPARHVAPTRRYFDAGNAFLDELLAG